MKHRNFIKISSFLFLQIGLTECSFAQDWPNLTRYRDANEKLQAEPNTGDRVVYMGDSITDFWISRSPDFFSDKCYVDRGINGQTSPQMLLRFRADVINLKPKVVVILCGTNDIAGNTGLATLEMIENNIASMAELTKMNRIKAILCSVLPTSDFEHRPADKIDSLNAWIKAYTVKNHLTYLDYYSAFVDEKKGMRSEYTGDGLHPNKAGYLVMEKLVQPAIEKLSGTKKKSNNQNSKY